MRANEAEFLKRARAGDSTALNKLILLHRQGLLMFIRRKVPADEARDVCQEVLIAASRNLDSFNGCSSFRTWLFAIAKNAIAGFHRADRSSTLIRIDDWGRGVAEAGQELQEPLKAAGDIPRNCDIGERIRCCVDCLIGRLTLDQQLAVILSDIHGFTDREASEATGATVGKFRHLLHDARLVLDSVSGQQCALVRKTGTGSSCAGRNPKPRPLVRPDCVSKIDGAQSKSSALFLLRATLLSNLHAVLHSS